MESNFHILNIALFRSLQVEHMLSEKSILANVDHPFIVRLSGSFQGSFVIF
jgi:hypothetical protein